MKIILASAFLAFFKLFPILNPPAMSPVFQEITAGVTDSQRNRMAFDISRNTFYLLVSILLVGGWLLKILGVSIDMIGIAGGLLLFHTAWGMLNRNDRVTHLEKQEIESVLGKEFFPLTMPMTAGPGAIAVTLAMVPNSRLLEKISILHIVGTSIGIAMSAFAVWLFYRFSGAFISRLGENGKATIGQISAFLLLAIGVQLTWTSLSNLIRTL
ncbi:MAG: MarC family protein [Holophagales bacterium]|jgi:multiple antibiotic resistance protein|nr:MarC family protein [Holophagales bacterium]